MTMYFGIYIKYLMIGLILGQNINILGKFYIAEIFAILYFFFAKKKYNIDELYIIIFGLTWFISQIISDILNNTNLIDSIKGGLTPVFFVLSLFGLLSYFKEINNLYKIISILLGINFGVIINLYLFPNHYFELSQWKFGLGYFFINLFFIYISFFCKKKFNVIIYGLLFFNIILSLYFDSRGVAIFPLLTFIFYKSINFFKIKESNFKNTILIKNIFYAILILYFLNYLFSQIFSLEFTKLLLSEDAYDKYYRQASSDLGILFGGRSELLISIQAFLDRPVFGFGSWAIDKYGYVDEYTRTILNLGLYDEGVDIGLTDRGYLIPAHSFIMGSFVWSGFFGGLFWIYVIIFSMKIFLKNYGRLPIYFYNGIILLMWDIFFSPLAYSTRFQAEVFLSFFITFVYFLKIKSKLN